MVTTPDGVKQHWERIGSLTLKVFDRLFPWLREGDREPEQEAEQLKRLWAEAFGDPTDPATQERIMATARALDPTMGD